MNPLELTVRQVMLPNPMVVRPDRPVGEILLLMNQMRVGSVLVCDHSERLVGIFTERDLLRRVADAVPGWRDYPVSLWMTRDPHIIGPDAGWDQAFQVMSQFQVRHLPVVENERVMGLLSARMMMDRRAEYLDHRVNERTQELRRANDQLMARDLEVLHNMRAAGRLLKNLLPHTPPTWSEMQWAVHYAPLDHLGGDYYDFVAPDNDHLGFLIADASGHSIAAAVVAIMTRFTFAEVAKRTTSPGEVLTALNQRLCGITEERFVTAFYGVFHRRTRILRYANAGHPYPLWVEHESGLVKPLSAQGFLLGIVPDEIYTEREVQLAPGDTLCFFTDGLLEARNEIGEQFGTKNLTACLRHRSGSSVRQMVSEILDCQSRFSGHAPITDDLTLTVCRVTEPPTTS
jgi:serine phosphatase RsbU (regulator of sigma subunit)